MSFLFLQSVVPCLCIMTFLYIFLDSFLLKQGASLSAVNCDGDVPLDIVLDETTESLLHEFTLRQGKSFKGSLLV